MGLVARLVAMLVLVAGLAAVVLVVAAAVGLLAAVAVTAYTVGAVVVTVCRAGLGVLRDVERGHLLVAPPDPAPPGRDPGYRSYYFGPAWRDCADVLAESATVVRRRTLSLDRHDRSVLGRIFDVWRLPDELDSWPAVGARILAGGGVLGGFAGLALGTAVVVVFLGITAVVFSVLLGALIGTTLAICGALRLVELAALRVRGITVECPSCHRRVGVPVYECPTCQELHHRLVPGSLGVFARTCRCRSELPTLLIKGRWRLRAHCSHTDCQGVLPIGVLTVPTRHVPVVAGKVAGKTVHTLAAVFDLQTADDGFAFGDDRTKVAFATVEDQLRNIAAVPSTLPTTPLRAATFFTGTGSGRRLVYVYDAAGEHYQSSDRVASLRFLGSTAGLLFVVDPFSLGAVRRRMEADDVELPPHSTAPPDDVISRIADGLRERAVERHRDRFSVRVAVVLTKCDVLVGWGSVPHPYEMLAEGDRAARSAAVATWLDEVAGEGGLVRQLSNQYGEVGYFAVSALDVFGDAPHTSVRTGRPVGNDRPSAPLRWVLAARTESA